MRYPSRFAAYTRPTSAMHARADELLRNAPGVLLIRHANTRLYPCVVVFCGTEYFGVEIHGPRPGPVVTIPAIGGGYIHGFMRTADLRTHCLREYQIDPANPLPLPPARGPIVRWLEKLFRKSGRSQQQSWAEYLARDPRRDAANIYLEARAATASMVARSQQWGFTGTGEESQYNICINMPLINFGIDFFLKPYRQIEQLHAFEQRCMEMPEPDQSNERHYG